MAEGGAPARILVIKLGALGDVVQALGPMAAIRHHHAGAHITALTRKPFDTLIAAAGVADDIRYDPRPGPVDVGGWLALRKHLRQGNFARVYDLQTSSRSSHYYKLFWPGPYPEWSGIAGGCSHPHANPDRDRMHTVERQAEQLRMAGIDGVPLSDLSGLGADVQRFALPERYCLIVPGGARHRPGKRWPEDRYRDAVRHIAERGVTPVIVGGVDERDLAAAIAEDCADARNLAGETTLPELVAVAGGAAFALGNDSGPMHIAAMAGVPSVVLYSHASDPALCGQRGPAVTILRRPDLSALAVDEVIAALPVAS